jgi:hypothetical protein
MDGATGIITATSFSGSGIGLTSLPAGNLTGTVADARISTLTASKLSGDLPAISGASLTNLDAGNLTGILPAISGENLTGITADGVGAIGGLTVKNQNGALVGTGGSISTIDFAGSIGVDVTASSGASGIATVKVLGPGADPTILSMIF